MSICPTSQAVSAVPQTTGPRSLVDVSTNDGEQNKPHAVTEKTPAVLYAPSVPTPQDRAVYRPAPAQTVPSTAPAAAAQSTEWASNSIVEATSGTILAIAYGQPVMLTKMGTASSGPSSEAVLPSTPRPPTPAATPPAAAPQPVAKPASAPASVQGSH